MFIQNNKFGGVDCTYLLLSRTPRQQVSVPQVVNVDIVREFPVVWIPPRAASATIGELCGDFRSNGRRGGCCF